MRVPRFHLASLMALMAIVCVAIVMVERWWAFDAQGALEAALFGLWLLSFFAGWRAYQGAGRVMRITALVGTIWTLACFATHAMFSWEMRAYGYSTLEILTRAALVSVVGTLATVVLAGLGAIVPRHLTRWHARSTRRKFVSLVVLSAVLFGLFTTANLLGFAHLAPHWQPQRIAARDFDEPNKLRAVIQHQTNRGEYIDIQAYGDFYLGRASSELLIHDAQTGRHITRISAASGWSFVTACITSDGAYVAAIQTNALNSQGRSELLRWNTLDGQPQEARPLPARELEDKARAYVSLAGDWAVTTCLTRDSSRRMHVSYAILDLRSEEPEWREFGNFDVEGSAEMALPTTRHPDGFLVSADGEYVVEPLGMLRPGARHIFRRSTQDYLLSPYLILGFHRERNWLVCTQVRMWPYLKGPDAGGDRPPFWDHGALGLMTRVLLTQLPDNRVLTRSPWMRGQPSLDGTRTQVILQNYGDIHRLPIAVETGDVAAG